MAVSPLDAIAQADNSAKMGSMPSPEASRRKPRESPSLLAPAAYLALRSGNPTGPTCGLEMVQRPRPQMVRPQAGADPWRKPDVRLETHAAVQRWQFDVRSPLGSASTLEELGKALGSARRQAREMREQGLLRETTRQMIDRVLGHLEISR